MWRPFQVHLRVGEPRILPLAGMEAPNRFQFLFFSSFSLERAPMKPNEDICTLLMEWSWDVRGSPTSDLYVRLLSPGVRIE
jgi:hypothetical protein